MRIFLLSLLSLIFMSGCQSIQPPLPNIEKTPDPMATGDLGKISADVTLFPVETPPAQATSDSVLPEITQIFDPFTEGFIVKAKNDLKQQIGIEPDKINVLSVEAVEWPDGSLGCGRPGTEYLQVVTPGFQILLVAEGQVYTYHTDTLNQIILCIEKPLSPTP